MKKLIDKIDKWIAAKNLWILATGKEFYFLSCPTEQWEFCPFFKPEPVKVGERERGMDDLEILPRGDICLRCTECDNFKLSRTQFGIINKLYLHISTEDLGNMRPREIYHGWKVKKDDV